MDKEHAPGDQDTKDHAGTREPDHGRTPDKDDVATGKESNRPKWLVPAASAAVVVALIAAGVVCLRVVSNREHTQAVERCSGAVARLEKPAGGAAARTARYQEAAAISSDQVKDTKTVIAMARAVKNAGGIKPQPVRCDASMQTGELKAAADKAEDLNGRYDKLDRAAKKDEASRLLGDSDGKVADNATREALQNAITLAEQTKGGKAKAWRDAVGPLQAAIDQVNASMQAKAQADQQAAEQAAQAAAQQQAQAVQQAAPSYGASYQPSYGQGGGGGGWSAPAPAAPAPSTPQGNSQSWNDFLNEPDNSMHGCRPDGGCGIG